MCFISLINIQLKKAVAFVKMDGTVCRNELAVGSISREQKYSDLFSSDLIRNYWVYCAKQLASKMNAVRIFICFVQLTDIFLIAKNHQIIRLN